MNAEASISAPGDGAKAPETVLVVDDSRAHRRLMCGTLRRWGFEPLEAEDGIEALAICEDEDIGLVVSDWMMPKMNGIAFCREYRRLMQGRPGYFILLTAQTEREVLAEGLESGADDFLSKPVSSVELRARLRAGLRVLHAQRDLASKNKEISRTLEQLSEAYAAIDRDLREARRFQEALVPDRHLSLDGTDISILYQPCGHVGGDMVGYFPIREGEIGIYAADVSGHGVESALMTARIASYFSGSAPERNIALERTGSGYVMSPPDEVCVRLNTLLQKDADSDLYLTMVLAHLSLDTGRVVMCQAGHPSPLIMRVDGSKEFREEFGMPIGLVDDVEFSSSEIGLSPGDKLMLYSDGITECPDVEGNLLDEEGLIEILKRTRGSSGPEVLTSLVASLEAFAGSQEFPDDLSAVLIERF